MKDIKYDIRYGIEFLSMKNIMKNIKRSIHSPVPSSYFIELSKGYKGVGTMRSDVYKCVNNNILTPTKNRLYEEYRKRKPWTRSRY